MSHTAWLKFLVSQKYIALGVLYESKSKVHNYMFLIFSKKKEKNENVRLILKNLRNNITYILV